MDTYVNVFIQRHGMYDTEGNLTQEGKVRIERFVRAHLMGREIHGVFSSDKPRGRQTAEHQLKILNLKDKIKIREEPGFGHSSIEGMLAHTHPWKPFEEIVLARQARREPTPLRFMLENYFPTHVIRHVLGITMNMLVRQASHQHGLHELNLLCGGHASGAWAAPEDMLDTSEGYPDYGEIMHYRWAVTSLYAPAKLILCKHLTA